MSTYAIGDVQGCLAALHRLLDAIAFKPGRDQLWLAGDLVNRGPDSLGVLRLLRTLGEDAVCVLGNHDLHLLARADGKPASPLDTLDDLLAAPDAAPLLQWLRQRPLLHEGAQACEGWAMSHAGLAPEWTLDEARAVARRIEQRLRGPDASAFLSSMYGNEPSRWADAKDEAGQLRFGVNAFTRMRYCAADGRLEFHEKGRPGQQAPQLQPWFVCPTRRAVAPEWIFGHWSALGRVHWPEHRAWGLDTGAVWGGRLTALCLETRALTQVECPENRRPGQHGGD
jgi:bis(5'-nucleosyl)-tetraphosphatase (symmetrical)